MNARRVNAAAGVISAAMKTRRTPAGIAAALESARLLQSSETAAEQKALQARVAELEALVQLGGQLAEQRHLVDAMDHAFEAMPGGEVR